MSSSIIVRFLLEGTDPLTLYPTPNHNAVCEQFHGTILQECWRPACRSSGGYRRGWAAIGDTRCVSVACRSACVVVAGVSSRVASGGVWSV
jgi:hypothetical protein